VVPSSIPSLKKDSSDLRFYVVLPGISRNILKKNLYSSPNIIRMIMSNRIRWSGHVERMRENRNAYRTLVGKPEGKRPLGRPRRRWVDDIKIYLREIG
jgi:hypothetical protein